MNTSLTFPVSAETFTAYQENGLERVLSEAEREAMMVWLPIINDVYLDSANGDTESIQNIAALMWELIARNRANATLYRFLRATLLWILRAWKQGFAEYNAEKGDIKSDAV